jgi:galactokinase
LNQNLLELHSSIYSKVTSEKIFAKVPGKVNLIGNHIDYNDGFVMPIGIDKYIYGVAAPRNDEKINIYSVLYRELKTIDLNNIKRDENNSWINYPAGVMKVLIESGYKLMGADFLFWNDLPANSGLGSSAAIEIITGFLLLTLSNQLIDRKELAFLCRKAENEFVGVKCGIMDQFTSSLSQKNYILFIDCIDYSYDYIPFDEVNYALVLCDTKKNRTLATSEYNKRRDESRIGFDIFKKKYSDIKSFRDITLTHIDEIKKNNPNYKALNRINHIVSEIDRVKKSKKALLNNDYIDFGKFMSESHDSSKNYYEVSCHELDLMQQLSLKFPGVLGSRLTGAGFGGCVINLIERKSVDALKEFVEREYSRMTGIKPDIMLVNTSDGINLI